MRPDALDFRPGQLMPAGNATLAHFQPMTLRGFIGAMAFDHAPPGLISLRQCSHSARMDTVLAMLLLPAPGNPAKGMHSLARSRREFLCHVDVRDLVTQFFVQSTGAVIEPKHMQRDGVES